MITTYDAYQEVLKLVNVGINEASQGIFTQPPIIRWPYSSRPEKPPSNGVWCEVYISTDNEQQSAFTIEAGDNRGRVYDVSGTIGIIVRAPVSMTDVPKWYINFASKLRNTFRKKIDGCVWYRNSRISDNLNVENDFYLFSVVSEFNFSEIVGVS